jgi:hypothetical protein
MLPANAACGGFRTELKASWVQIQSAIRTVAIDGGLLVDEWEVVGEEVSASMISTATPQGSKSTSPSPYAELCFR